MKLVTGGAYQGKLAYASDKYKIETWTDGRSCGFEEIFTCPGLNHFQDYIRRALEDDREISSLAEQLARKNPEIVIITDELGCGIVPMSAFDRQFRETHGRICCRIAERSDEVSRVICGIGTVIKGGNA